MHASSRPGPWRVGFSLLLQVNVCETTQDGAKVLNEGSSTVSRDGNDSRLSIQLTRRPRNRNCQSRRRVRFCVITMDC
ncbi:hypothetical protein B0T26DRAFT_524174 [Lasiosphaeria miniovina]|uniref:Secreted protein n=1 Tax=Lasiosphaeria miniovina TaxID=1954250 RepID=A0AA40DFK4_9PEZI|nr:uncharacterized protein B0T26DRAFT_524174 [Lasiosphaeria miniovina]KAK0701614.1 hypothetical protein B0T26DRAFT_524174 [Lasiosphaeria miniovina]